MNLIRGRYAYRILILFLAIVISFLAFNYEVNGKPYDICEFVADFDQWTQTVVKNKSSFVVGVAMTSMNKLIIFLFFASQIDGFVQASLQA